MGLAPYGEAKYKDLILSKIVDLKEDGTFRLDQSYFNYCTGLTMTNDKFAHLFGNPVRDPSTDLLTPFHMDIAGSIQAVTDEIILRLTRSLAREYKIPNLCLAGGVALNCVANGKVLRDGAFENVSTEKPPCAGEHERKSERHKANRFAESQIGENDRIFGTGCGKHRCTSRCSYVSLTHQVDSKLRQSCRKGKHKQRWWAFCLPCGASDSAG